MSEAESRKTARTPPKRTADEAKARRKLERMTGRKLPRALHCSFCGKSQHEVDKLVAGPMVFICGECVGWCNDALAGRTIAPIHMKLSDRTNEQVLELMASLDYAAEGSRDHLQQIVDTLRGREVSWADIGAALGVSRQSAWERFS